MARQRSFQSILKDAVKTAQFLREAEAVKSRKLSPHAFLLDALRLAGVPADELESLPENVADFPGPAASHDIFDKLATLQRALADGRLRNAEGAIARLKKTYAGEAGFVFTRPTVRVGGYVGPAEQEIFAIGVPPTILAVEAVRQLAIERPEVFGTCDDADEFDGRVLEAKSRFERFASELERTWAGEDVVASTSGLSEDEQRRGLTCLTFRIAPNVTVGPDCGRRLVNAVLAEGGARDFENAA